MKRFHLGAALAAGLFLSNPASAIDVFELNITSGLQTIDLGFSTFEDMIDQLDPDRLQRQFDQANDPRFAPVSAAINFRGLTGVSISFPDAATGQDNQGSRLLFTVNFQDLQISREVDRGTRSDSLRALFDILKTEKNLLKELLAGLARYSPIDPLAGNPDSLFGKKMKSDMDNGFKHKVSQVWGCGTSAFNIHDEQPILIAATGDLSDIFAEAQSRAAELQAQNEFGIGLSYTKAKAETPAGDYNTTAYLIPISYTAKLDFNPSHKIRFDFPIGYSDTEGAEAVSLGVGMAYTYPISNAWTITPAAGLGATGSIDLLSAGGVNSFSVTSAYTWRLSDWALSMGNSIGKYSSVDLNLGDVEVGPDISNTAFTNGFILTGPNSLISRNLVMEYSFTNTQISGDKVYTDQYNEIGVSLGRMGMDMGIIDNYMKLGLSYLVATGDFADITATKLNFAARF